MSIYTYIYQKSKTYILDDSIVFDEIDRLINSLEPSVQDKVKNGDYLMPDERELVDNNDYEEYNFDEEELEDDDYYNEDLD